MRLEAVVESIIDKHREELVPVRNRAAVPIQETLFREEPTPSSKAVAMGRFYEVLTAALYGGKVTNYVEVDNGNGDGDDTVTLPDVVDRQRKAIWESKACRAGHHCTLSDYQIEGYKSLQCGDPQPVINYIIFRHRIKGIKSTWKGTQDDLVRELTERTLYAVVLPLSLVLELHKPENRHNGLVYRYNGTDHGSYDECTTILSSTITRLLTEPERVIEQLKLNPGVYKIKRMLSPEDLRINKYRTRQFPLVRISDKKHRKWAREFVRERMGDVPF